MTYLSSQAEALVTSGPPPDWADLSPSPHLDRSTPGESQAGRCAWLSDSQINLTGPELVMFHRTVYEVTSPDGLQASGTLQLNFDPAYQRLVIHHVRVIRGGVVREVDPLPSLELLRRERNLERAVFDGRLTATMSIPDVQVGDIVDTCHSETGAHPVLAGRYCSESLLSWQCWVGETRVRLIAPADRAMRFQTWNGAPDAEIDHTASGDVVRTWRSLATPPVVLEGFTPSWVRQFASVRIADEMSWAEVAETFADYYRPEPLPADLEAAVAALAEETAEPRARIVKALRLVQGGIRYQAVSIGTAVSSHDLWTRSGPPARETARMRRGCWSPS